MKRRRCSVGPQVGRIRVTATRRTKDASWGDGHAADPRSQEGDLTNDPLAWCGTQMQMNRAQLDALSRYWPKPGQSFEDETRGFDRILRAYLSCPVIASHYIGGQELSRAHLDDPGSQVPIVPVSRAQERRAFDLIARYLFNPSALNVSPRLLQRLGYAEWAGYGYTSWDTYGNLPTWAYNPPQRHDFPLVERINDAQLRIIDYFFQPTVLQRIDENPMESTTATMSMSDLFDWLHAAVLGNLKANDIPLAQRNLQTAYIGRLDDLANKPDKNVPSDATALARAELHRIASQADKAQRRRHDGITSAHLTDLVRRANAALR